MKEKSLDFLKTSLGHQMFFHNALDQKASWLLGISGVIFVLSLSYLNLIGFKIMAIFSLIAALANIWVISFPFRHERSSSFSFLCWKGIKRMTLEDYQKEAKRIFKSDKKIADEYYKEIHSLVEHSIKPKSRLIRLGSLLLTLGFVISFFSIVLELWLNL